MVNVLWPLLLSWEYCRILWQTREQNSTQRWAMTAKAQPPFHALNHIFFPSSLSPSSCKSLLMEDRRMTALLTYPNCSLCRQRREEILYYEQTHWIEFHFFQDSHQLSKVSVQKSQSLTGLSSLSSNTLPVHITDATRKRESAIR